ncbi:MAG: DUF448 domain-containing protein [Emcibacter sp.]|nr:DUF448 domain-containing protein [Emcibacter sp.]
MSQNIPLKKAQAQKNKGQKRERQRNKGSKDRSRRCLVTGETYAVSKLIRFVLDPEGRVIPDVAGKLPGRGGWVLADGNTLELAMKKKIFVRFGHRALAPSSGKSKDVETLEEPDKEKVDVEEKKDKAAKGRKSRVTVDDNLPHMVEQLLRQRCLDYLGLVNRTGLLVSGFEKVRATLKAGKCRALVTAEDAAEGGHRKICSGLGNVLDKLRMIDMFTREQLGQTLGLSNAVHVALLPGGMTESFLKEFSRYEGVVMR